MADRRFEVALAGAERLAVRARHVEPAVLPVARESCQKLVSCSAVHTASDASIERRVA